MPEQCRAANGKTQGAADLLREYGGLDTILAALRFPSQAEALPLYDDYVRSSPSAARSRANMGQVFELARGWGLNQLADRLAEPAAAIRGE
jgi:hypothetical protein